MRVDIHWVKRWSFGSTMRFNNGNPYRDFRIGPIMIRYFWRKQ
jgi:hypothetical protein